jgi:hypothetical protein
MRKDIHRSRSWSYASAPTAHMVGGIAVMVLVGTLWPGSGDHGSDWAPWALNAASRWTWRWISLGLLAIAILIEKIATDIGA